ncbi:DUF3784 domain-containing protein [Alkalibaculum bacchi]|uniref:DUF3784 domain-containing protein n=1 Tax=Alkalibaculum bacchi TaxID=645887 RepID=UPI0026F2E5CA|nr:DUF3784 domain-containing protein [Alkalibaculum bacchi]
MKEYIDVVILVVFLIMTILLLIGNGAGFVAGLNTMPKQEREQYDSRKISRQMGVIFLFIDVPLLLTIILDRIGKWRDQYSDYMAIYTVIVAIAGVVYIRKSNKK